MSMEEVSYAIRFTASGIVTAESVILKSLLLGLDGATDPFITIYNAQVISIGNEAVPGNTYDASRLDLNGFIDLNVNCNNGIYVLIGGAGIGTGYGICYVRYV